MDDQEKVEEHDKNRKTETESSEYEEANEENSTHDDLEDRENNEDNHKNEEHPIELRNRRKSRGTTRTVMKVRRNLRREEEETKLKKRNIRRSERIRDKQSAMLVLDEGILKNIEEAKKSNDWRHWRQAVEDELTSVEEHEVWNIVKIESN